MDWISFASGYVLGGLSALLMAAIITFATGAVSAATKPTEIEE